MNHATRFTKLTLLLIAAGALALAGCGGDDGVSQSMHDQVQAELDQAQQDLMDAEAERDQAQEDLMDAEAERDQAQEDLMDAQADDDADADAIDQAETERDEAEAERDEAQQDLMDAQSAAAQALMDEQDKASAAMEAAKMASDAAKTASDEAAMATMNLATTQTGAMSAMHAYNAKKYAKMAMDEYMKAKAASTAAMETDDVATAALEASKAVMAQEAAENAAMMVANDDMTGYADMAKAAAMTELMIDGTMKSVGDTTIDATAGASSVTTGTGDDAQTVITGLIASMNPEATGAAITGNARTDAVPDNLGTLADETAEAIPYKQTAAARTFDIGKTLDSDDDMARLMLITHYAGLDMVRIFSAGDTGGTRTGTQPGRIGLNSTANDGTQHAVDADANNTILRSLGMFVPVSGGTAGTLAPTDSVADDAEPVEVFVYTYTDASNVLQTVYATLMTTSTTGGTTTYTYNIDADIDAAVLQDGPDDGTDSDVGQVISGIPAAVAYQHLHFGVWADLGMAAKNGSQEIDGIGIGFVQSIGDGMTGADMPNSGSATYNGNWVATIEGAAGGVELTDGVATLTADFAKATLEAELEGLATLESTIDGNEFSGTEATVMAANMYGLTTASDFEGTFSGGFYGAKAVEAGGIFDFTSASSGAFRGALGGSTKATAPE